MEISFVDSDLAQACNDDAVRAQRFGPVVAPVLRRRLSELAAAVHLAELRRLPQARLRGYADGRLLVALGPAADLHLRAGGDPPRLADGQLIEWAVHALLVTDVQLAPAV
ncbi:hypothetical protein [Actinacidiphila bryophytorum]|uniref:hypothetical protein n=1 Tax=Actinacidiphila bryophytorum TaxID=1436133 RepID=UPI002176B3EA|nr:hypothetical protein [Actinacidiphila bryophytorum]UWE10194.1 hypothetical protein NYE86_16735 [Actinacidiphila bryophytorum]